MSPDPETEQPEKPVKPGKTVVPWRTGLLMGGSALLGGIAVVLWNRRLLSDLRAEIKPPPTMEATDED